MSYSTNEIELTLNFYSIAILQLKTLGQDKILKNNLSTIENNSIFYYSHLIKLVDFWLSHLLPDEVEIIESRIFKKKTFDLIAIELGYANHSSVVRKYQSIIHKLSEIDV